MEGNLTEAQVKELVVYLRDNRVIEAYYYLSIDLEQKSKQTTRKIVDRRELLEGVFSKLTNEFVREFENNTQSRSVPETELGTYLMNRCFTFRWLWHYTDMHADERPQILHPFFEQFVQAADILRERGAIQCASEPKKGLFAEESLDEMAFAI